MFSVNGRIAEFAIDSRTGDLILVRTLHRREDVALIPLTW